HLEGIGEGGGRPRHTSGHAHGVAHTGGSRTGNTPARRARRGVGREAPGARRRDSDVTGRPREAAALRPRRLRPQLIFSRTTTGIRRVVFFWYSAKLGINSAC